MWHSLLVDASKTSEHLERLARSVSRVLDDVPEIAAAWIFGSVARGDAGPDSDLDLGVVFARRGETARDHRDAILSLAARLEGPADGRRIDLVALESQGPIFAHEVLAKGVLVHEKDRERRIDFESETHVRYFDWKRTVDAVADAADEGLRRRLERLS